MTQTHPIIIPEMRGPEMATLIYLHLLEDKVVAVTDWAGTALKTQVYRMLKRNREVLNIAAIQTPVTKTWLLAGGLTIQEARAKIHELLLQIEQANEENRTGTSPETITGSGDS